MYKKVKKMNWIKLEDKLPLHYQNILVCDKRGDIYMACIWTYDAKINDIPFVFVTSDGTSIDDVTHWMPLPEPPNE